MITQKSIKYYTGLLRPVVLITVALMSVSSASIAAPTGQGPYVDVPAHHVAAKAVAQLKAKGIVSGYADGTYRGAQPVTRYELAIILARFVKFYDHSTQPLSTSVVPLPASPVWAASSRQYLATNHYLPVDSPIFKSPGTKPVTADQLAQSMTSIYDRIVDRSLPPDTNQ